MSTVNCPECDAQVELAAGTEVGEILVCSDCGVDLEITRSTLPRFSSHPWNRKIGESNKSRSQNDECRI